MVDFDPQVQKKKTVTPNTSTCVLSTRKCTQNEALTTHKTALQGQKGVSGGVGKKGKKAKNVGEEKKMALAIKCTRERILGKLQLNC